jgi:hypothetical protein
MIFVWKKTQYAYRKLMDNILQMATRKIKEEMGRSICSVNSNDITED